MVVDGLFSNGEWMAVLIFIVNWSDYEEGFGHPSRRILAGSEQNSSYYTAWCSKTQPNI